MITKRFLSGGIDGDTYSYSDPTAVLGFTTAYDPSGNKLYERHLHAENRSHLYQAYGASGSSGSNTVPLSGSYDSIDRLLQYQRGTLSIAGGPANAGGGTIATPISLTNTNTQQTYTLDGLGNWRRTGYTPVGGSLTNQVRQHNGLNEITSVSFSGTATDFSYDGSAGHSNGNLANDGIRIMTWDALNRLAEVQRVSDSAVIQQAVFDALNRRIRVTVSNGGLPENSALNGTTDCLYLGWRCVEERQTISGTDTPTKQYIWGIYLDELLQQRQLVTLNGFAASAAADLYPLQDLLYRTTGLADSAGTIREAYDTDAYGNTLVLRNSGTPPTAIGWSSDTQVTGPTCAFIFTGQRNDAEITAHYYKRREFVPRLGRFLTKDSSASGSNNGNVYQYVEVNPLVKSDPIGLDYVDFNFNWGFLFFGVTGGVYLYEGQLFPYIGGGLMTPGPGGSLTYGMNSSPSPGQLSGQLQGMCFAGGAISVDSSGNVAKEGGVGTPGASATVYYTFPSDWWRWWLSFFEAPPKPLAGAPPNLLLPGQGGAVPYVGGGSVGGGGGSWGYLVVP